MNVQQTILQGIKEQLFFNDYLVLPDFGGFVLKSRSSHISASGGTLTPPSKTISFNAQLRQNDGILATWLQNTLKCHASEALQHLKEFTHFCTGILNAKRRLTLEGIGFFYLDFENNICFEPQQDANFLASSFGLIPVSIRPLAIEKPEPVIEEKKEHVFVDRTVHTTEPVKARRTYGKLVTPLLVAILFVSLLGLLVNNTTMKGELHSSLQPGNTRSNYIPSTYPELELKQDNSTSSTYVADANGIAALKLDNTKEIAVEAVKGAFSSMGSTSSGSRRHVLSHPGKFEIVLGCFTVLQNAERMVKKLSAKHIHAAVTGKNNKGMFVVSNGGYATKEEAIDRLIEVKEISPNAWIKSE